MSTFLLSEIVFIDVASSAKSIYHFDKSTYRLNGITNEFDRSTLAFAYDNNTSQINTITSSLGTSLHFEYNPQQLVEFVSLSGRDTETRNAR